MLTGWRGQDDGDTAPAPVDSYEINVVIELREFIGMLRSRPSVFERLITILRAELGWHLQGQDQQNSLIVE
jgi:hypothetical protein